MTKDLIEAVKKIMLDDYAKRCYTTFQPTPTRSMLMRDFNKLVPDATDEQRDIMHQQLLQAGYIQKIEGNMLIFSLHKLGLTTEVLLKAARSYKPPSTL